MVQLLFRGIFLTQNRPKRRTGTWWKEERRNEARKDEKKGQMDVYMEGYAPHPPRPILIHPPTDLGRQTTRKIVKINPT